MKKRITSAFTTLRPLALCVGSVLALSACSSDSDDSGGAERFGTQRISSIVLDADADTSTQDDRETRTFTWSVTALAEYSDRTSSGVLERTTYNNDTMNRVSQVSVDEGNDGLDESLILITYDEQDREDTRTTTVLATNARQVETQVYDDDSDGLWTGTMIDANGDGTDDDSINNLYNASGQRMGQAYDIGMNGSIERTDTFIRGQNGQITSKNIDLDNDGTTDQIEFFDYEAAPCLKLQFSPIWGTYCQ